MIHRFDIAAPSAAFAAGAALRVAGLAVMCMCAVLTTASAGRTRAS